MRALASVGIFAEDDQGCFRLTPVGVTLQSDVPGSLRAWAILVLGDEDYQAWGDLMHTVQTGETAFEHVFGTGIFQYEAQHPAHAKIFDEAMANLIGVYNAAVLASYPFSMVDKLVDVGGGDGSLLVAILQANPQMTGALFDLPHVVEKAKQRIAQSGLENRCEIVAGDVFVSVPSGGEAYMISRVINSFDAQPRDHDTQELSGRYCSGRKAAAHRTGFAESGGTIYHRSRPGHVRPEHDGNKWWTGAHPSGA